MSYPEWPSDLPRPDRDTWQSAWTDPRLRRQNAAGPRGFRKRFSSVPKQVAMGVTLSHYERAVFNRFFEDELDYGVGIFTMPDPTTDGWPLLMSDGSPMLDHEGQPLLLAETWLCQWGDEMPVETVAGREFRIVFAIEVLP